MTSSAAVLRPGERLLWPWLLWLLPVLPLAILLLSALVPPRPLALQRTGDGSLLSEPFRLDSGPLGSPFLDVRATLPADTRVTYRLELLDPSDRVVLALSREGWRETGVWSEDGESGTYDESETGVPLLLRPAGNGLHRLRLRLEELSGSDGLPRTDPVPFRVRLARHRVNAPLLALTAATGLVSTGCAWMALYGHCRARHRLCTDEARAGVRTDLGPGLLRVSLALRYGLEESAPVARSVPVRFLVRDGLGRSRLHRIVEVPLGAFTVNDEEYRRGGSVLHLRLPERRNLRLQVEVPPGLGPDPDALERLELLLEDGVRVPRAVPVLEPWNAP